MNMERVKKILKKLFCLPLLPTLLIAVPSYVLVIYALAGENVEPVVTYVSYFLSAYALIITVTGITGIHFKKPQLLYGRHRKLRRKRSVRRP